MKFFKVTEFSKATGLSVKALRLYEKAGILIPVRMELNRYRMYSENQLELAQEIRILRATGFSIREVKALLPFKDQSCGTLMLLHAQFEKTTQTIATLCEQRDQIERLIKQTKNKSGGALQGAAGLFARRLVCHQMSESIKKLSDQEVREKTREIPSEEYLRTVAMVDNIARTKLLSVISEKVVKLVKEDLAELDKQYANFWK